MRPCTACESQSQLCSALVVPRPSRSLVTPPPHPSSPPPCQMPEEGLEAACAAACTRAAIALATGRADPEEVAHRLMLANVLLRDGRREEAVGALEEAPKIRMDTPESIRRFKPIGASTPEVDFRWKTEEEEAREEAVAEFVAGCIQRVIKRATVDEEEDAAGTGEEA